METQTRKQNMQERQNEVDLGAYALLELAQIDPTKPDCFAQLDRYKEFPELFSRLYQRLAGIRQVMQSKMLYPWQIGAA